MALRGGFNGKENVRWYEPKGKGKQKHGSVIADLNGDVVLVDNGTEYIFVPRRKLKRDTFHPPSVRIAYYEE